MSVAAKRAAAADFIAMDFMGQDYAHWLSEVWKGWESLRGAWNPVYGTFEEYFYGHSSWWINETCLDLDSLSDVEAKYPNFWNYLEDVRRHWPAFRRHITSQQAGR